jgi:pyroglutamyl-peptidase
MARRAARNQKRGRFDKSSARTQRPQLLVYGFGPYDEFVTNITANALRKLGSRESLKKIVFPVRFNKSQFVHAVRKHNPDIILGLGQCSRGARFRIERRAVNRKRKRQSAKATAIHVGGPRWLNTTLPLITSRKAGRSQDAGTYVCNFSMYVLLDYIRDKRRSTKFGFIHIPFDSEVGEVAGYLENLLDRLEVSFRS